MQADISRPFAESRPSTQGCAIDRAPSAVSSQRWQASYLAKKVGTPKETAAFFLEELFKLAVKEAKGGAGKFVIPDIGHVVKARRKARMGRNPQTGEAIEIKAKTVARMRTTKSLKDAVLKGNGWPD